MTAIRKLERKPLKTATRKINVDTFLRHARALGEKLGGDHSHTVEFEPQTLGVLGRFRMIHETPMSADQWTKLEHAAFRAGMHGFREVHAPQGGRTGSVTIVFDATDSAKVRAAFRKAHGFSAKETKQGMAAKYRSD